MKNSEEAIQKVLAGLRNSETPAGMERRILNALQDRASQPQSTWRRLRPAWLAAPAQMVAATPRIYAISLASIIAVALTISAIHHHGHPTAHSTPTTTLSASSPSKPSPASAKAKRLSPQIHSVQATETATAPQTESFIPADSDESIALSEMHAASYPAPPMPLTQQERLLLRIAQRGNLVELAMLVPSLRALQEAEENAEFQRFFGQSAKQATPAPSATEQTEQPTSPQSTPEQAQPETEQSSPAQSTPEQPDKLTPDQPDTQQPAPRQPGTGEHQ